MTNDELNDLIMATGNEDSNDVETKTTNKVAPSPGTKLVSRKRKRSSVNDEFVKNFMMGLMCLLAFLNLVK